MNSKIGVQGVFWIHACICFVGGLFAVFFMKETKTLNGKERRELFEQMDTQKNQEGPDDLKEI